MTEDADGLLAELLADSRPVTRGCMVCQWLEGREDAAEWDRAFANDKITDMALMRGMRARGFEYKIKPVGGHRTEQHRVA